ncbi:MAG: MarR family transcriptional regulator [Rhodospirillales bacterium]|nr:MarR family transcriptional regulator [Rhodospirillales bacterium]
MVAAVDSPKSQLSDRPGHLIRRLHQIHVAMFLEECAAYSLTPVQYAVMTVLAHRPGMDQISIASEAAIDRTNVADVLSRLEERGIVSRQISPTDRRMKLAVLTDEGARITRDMEVAMQRAQDRFLSPLPADRRGEFMKLLADLVEANNAFSRAPAR